MTKPQKKMLAEIAAGADPNIAFQVAKLSGKREAADRMARTMLALHRQGLLRIARGDGLEITDKGSAAVSGGGGK